MNSSYVEKIIKSIETSKKGIEFPLSVQKPDRSNDIVMVKGINTTNYLLNPVVLFNHNQDLVVGKAINLRAEGDTFYGEVEFQEETQLGKETKALVEQGFLNAVSIGFLPKVEPKEFKIDEEMRKSGEFYPYTDTVRVFEEVDLIEFSIVTTPANPHAVRNSLRDEIVKSIGEDSIILKHLDLPEIGHETKVCSIGEDCGCTGEVENIETKAGAVLNKTNFERLDEIIRIAKEIRDSAQREESKQIQKPKIKLLPKKTKFKRFNGSQAEELLNKIKED